MKIFFSFSLCYFIIFPVFSSESLTSFGNTEKLATIANIKDLDEVTELETAPAEVAIRDGENSQDDSHDSDDSDDNDDNNNDYADDNDYDSDADNDNHRVDVDIDVDVDVDENDLAQKKREREREREREEKNAWIASCTESLAGYKMINISKQSAFGYCGSFGSADIISCGLTLLLVPGGPKSLVASFRACSPDLYTAEMISTALSLNLAIDSNADKFEDILKVVAAYSFEEISLGITYFQQGNFENLASATAYAKKSLDTSKKNNSLAIGETKGQAGVMTDPIRGISRNP